MHRRGDKRCRLTKKRITLTISDELNAQLQEYKAKNGITSDASACIQLIIRQLQSQANAEAMLKLVQNLSMEKLMELSQEGLQYTKEAIKDKKF